MGCSSAKSVPLPVVPKIVKRDPVTTLTDASCRHRETRCLENCIIVWLTTQSSIQVESMTKKLRHVVCTLKTFTDPNSCVSYIKDIREEKLFLILSPEMEQFVERIRHLPQLEKIYVFDASSQTMGNANDPSFRNIDDLCEQLRQDVEYCELDLIAISVIAAEGSEAIPFAALTKQTALFLCAQLIKEISLRVKYESEFKNIFLDFCRLHYAGDDEQLRAIDDFETNYRPQNVLRWLSTSCFVSRILHRVHRTQEVDIIYKMVFLIKQIQMQLIILHEKISSLTGNPLIVYRGKSMSSDEFDMLMRNNCGGLLSFFNFFTASIEKIVAVDFLHHRIATHPEMAAILFEILIDPMRNNRTNPFAFLDNFDPNVKSKKTEIYFNMATVFRIESVEQVTDASMIMWTVKLTLVDDNDQQLSRLVAPVRSSEVHANPSLYMGKLFIDMGEYNHAEQLFLNMLFNPTIGNQPRRLANIHKNLGAIFTCKGEHSKALEHYQTALEVSLNFLRPEHPELVPIYSKIGDSYFNNGDYVQALHHYERATQLMEHSAQSPDKHFIDDLNRRINEARELLELNT